MIGLIGPFKALGHLFYHSGPRLILMHILGLGGKPSTQYKHMVRRDSWNWDVNLFYCEAAALRKRLARQFCSTKSINSFGSTASCRLARSPVRPLPVNHNWLNHARQKDAFMELAIKKSGFHTQIFLLNECFCSSFCRW